MVIWIQSFMEEWIKFFNICQTWMIKAIFKKRCKNWEEEKNFFWGLAMHNAVFSCKKINTVTTWFPDIQFGSTCCQKLKWKFWVGWIVKHKTIKITAQTDHLAVQTDHLAPGKNPFEYRACPAIEYLLYDAFKILSISFLKKILI